jgi:nucleotide-binding universal stress UspA family protein
MSWKTIVVGYERDHASTLALERAAEIARDSGAVLIVTSIARVLPSGAAAHGIGPFDPADPPELHRAELAHARELLDGYHTKAEFDVEVGEPEDAIVALAERRGADLIVVGTHERTLLDRLLHGSVSEGVTRRAHCDVLVVRQ